MRVSRWSLVLAALLLAPSVARPGDEPVPGPSGPEASPAPDSSSPPASPAPDSPQASPSPELPPAAPPANEPAPPQAPPPPPASSPAPPRAQALAAPAVPPGQWVYTAQYGWIWMPYAAGYTYAPPGTGEPSMYVYYPAYGWTWVDAPWVWGLGPWPAFGVGGPVYFAWYGWGGWRHRWRPSHLGPRPVPYRPPFRVVPAPRLPLRSGAAVMPRAPAQAHSGHVTPSARSGSRPARR